MGVMHEGAARAAAGAQPSPRTPGRPERGALPPWRTALAVVAHPDDESFGLGGLLDAFHRAGAESAVLCFTLGEASTLHGVPGDLRDVRAAELRRAASLLGVGRVDLRAHPDGRLAAIPPGILAGEVAAVVRSAEPDGLLVFDTTGVTGHPDHVAATAAALLAAEWLDLPVLAWALPARVARVLNAEFGATFHGRPPAELHLVVRVDRAAQRAAARAHSSQVTATSALWRRLELLGATEHLRWLRVAGPALPGQGSVQV